MNQEAGANKAKLRIDVLQDACASPGLHYLATDTRQASEKLSSLANDLVRQNLRVEK